MYDRGHDARGHPYPPYRIVVSASVIEPPADPNPDKESIARQEFVENKSPSSSFARCSSCYLF
jgi:hypothetical protein